MIEYTARITSQDTPRVGGRNLIRRGDAERRQKGEFAVYRLYKPIEQSEPLTLSFDVVKVEKPPIGGRFMVFFFFYSNFRTYTSVKYEEGKKRYSVSVQALSYNYNLYGDKKNYDPDAVFIYPNDSYNSGGGCFTIANVKLERGTIATDWTPAPEDVAESISTVNTSLVSLASTLLDPNEGDIPQLFRQQENLSHAIGSKASQEDLNKYVTNIADVTNAIQSQLCDMSVFGISNSGYVDVKTRDTCPAPGQTILNGDLYAPTEYHTSQIRLTLRTDHDALARQVSDLQLQLNRCNLRLTATKQELDKLKATTAITPVLNTDTRKRSGSTTLYPQYGDWLLTSDSQEQYISFSGLSAEIGRSIYIQTRRKAYLNANGHSFLGLPSVSENQWLSNNTTYRFVRASATAWLVTSSSSPYPWT